MITENELEIFIDQFIEEAQKCAFYCIGAENGNNKQSTTRGAG